MSIGELEAFNTATQTAERRGWRWLPPFAIYLEDGEWVVHCEGEFVVRITEATGDVVDEKPQLAPLEALRIAKTYASELGLRWQPMFVLRRESGKWNVGANQSQFGGQLNIEISDAGNVLDHKVNPK